MPNEFLAKQQTDTWGVVDKEDWKQNDFSVKERFRILSAYKTAGDVKLWVITEADRSCTTVLLLDEY